MYLNDYALPVKGSSHARWIVTLDVFKWGWTRWTIWNGYGWIVTLDVFKYALFTSINYPYEVE